MGLLALVTLAWILACHRRQIIPHPEENIDPFPYTSSAGQEYCSEPFTAWDSPPCPSQPTYQTMSSAFSKSLSFSDLDLDLPLLPSPAPCLASPVSVHTSPRRYSDDNVSWPSSPTRPMSPKSLPRLIIPNSIFPNQASYRPPSRPCSRTTLVDESANVNRTSRGVTPQNLLPVHR